MTNSWKFERVWAQLARAQTRIQEELEQALKNEQLPPLSWYDVLLELRRTPRGLALFELEMRLLLAQHNASRLIDRMVSDGVVVKTASADDGRVRILRITQKGRRLMKKMAPVYGRAIEVSLSRRLTVSEARTIEPLLSKLADR